MNVQLMHTKQNDKKSHNWHVMALQRMDQARKGKFSHRHMIGWCQDVRTVVSFWFVPFTCVHLSTFIPAIDIKCDGHVLPTSSFLSNKCRFDSTAVIFCCALSFFFIAAHGIEWKEALFECWINNTACQMRMNSYRCVWDVKQKPRILLESLPEAIYHKAKKIHSYCHSHGYRFCSEISALPLEIGCKFALQSPVIAKWSCSLSCHLHDNIFIALVISMPFAPFSI